MPDIACKAPMEEFLFPQRICYIVRRLLEQRWVGLMHTADTMFIQPLMELLWSFHNSLSICDMRAGHIWRGSGVLWPPGSVPAAPAADAVPSGIRAGLPNRAAMEHWQLSQHLCCSGVLQLPLVDAKPYVAPLLA